MGLFDNQPKKKDLFGKPINNSGGVDDLLRRPQSVGEPLVASGDFTEKAFSWSNLSLDVVSGTASQWFEQCGISTVEAEIHRRGRTIKSELVSTVWPTFFGESANPAISGLVVEDSDFGDLVPISQSPLGQKLIGLLSRLGVAWEYQHQIAIGPSSEGVGSMTFIEDTSQTEGLGRWANQFGTPYQQSFKVYRDSAGKESILWSAQVLVANRPYRHIVERDMGEVDGDSIYWEISSEDLARGHLTQGEMAEFIHIPEFAKRAFYLAETPFPSTPFMALSRSLAFGETDSSFFPRPVVIYERDAHSWGRTRTESSDGFSFFGSLFPTVVRMGWVLPDMSDEDLATVVPVVSDGLSRISTLVEDGYRNFNRPDYPAAFDYFLDSAAALRQEYSAGGSAGGLSCWIPVSLVGYELEDTFELAKYIWTNSESNSPERLEELLGRIAENGTGLVVSNAINDLVFSYLVPNGQYSEAQFLLELVELMPAGVQSVNAFSNHGIVLFKLGLLDEAVEKFLEALSSPTKFAEAEASYYLAAIYESQGNVSEANVFRSRCEAAGGYSTEDGVEVVAPAESSQVSAPKFCSECGTAIVSGAKFCANCGHRV